MMAYSNQSWNNNNRNPGLSRPPTFPGRPPFIGGNGNMQLQNPRQPQRGPPPQQQFQNYSNMPQPPLAHIRSSLHVSRHPQFQNPPPPIPPATMTVSNPTLYQGFSVPPPNHGVHIERQPLSTAEAQNSLQNQNVHMMYGPPSLPPHASFQPRPTHASFPHNLPHNVSVNYQQSPGPDYGTVAQHKGVNNCQVEITNHRPQLDAKELGAQKLDKWLHKVGKSKKPHLKDSSIQKPSEQLWESLNHLKTLTQLIQVMSDKMKEMDNCASSASVSTWENMTNNLETCKDKFCSLEPSLERPSVQSIARKLIKMRHKRARLRRVRVSKFEEEQKLKESWMEKSQRIDKWLETHRAKIKEEIMRKSRKAAADCTLSKVSREIQDASRLIDTMLALQKLRLIRRDAAQKRGDTDLGESRQTFDQKIDDMTRLVQAQLDCYREEEAKLKLVIKSEQDEDTEKERLLQMERNKQKQIEENEEIQTMLFGSMEITESDPLFPYNQFYKQAENSLQSLVQIRHDWDSFLVPENTPTSSVIPSSWVLPELPSSATWASALK